MSEKIKNTNKIHNKGVKFFENNNIECIKIKLQPFPSLKYSVSAKNRGKLIIIRFPFFKQYLWLILKVYSIVPVSFLSKVF